MSLSLLLSLTEKSIAQTVFIYLKSKHIFLFTYLSLAILILNRNDEHLFP